MAGKQTLEDIIKGCKNGDNLCFSKLIDAYAKRLYGYFYRLTSNKDISDDLLSELFLKLVDNINSFKGASFNAWLFKIASNVFYDYLREKQKQQKIVENRQKVLEKENSETIKSSDDTYDKLQIQLEKLDEETKQLLILRFYSQLSFKELSEMYSEPIGTTLSKVHRGLRKLRQLME